MKKELLNCVVLSNDFARNAEIDLSCIEWKLLLYLISKIKKHECLFLKEYFYVGEFAGLFNVSSYEIIRRAAKKN